MQALAVNGLPSIGCSVSRRRLVLGRLGRHTIVKWSGWPSKRQHFEADDPEILLVAGYEPPSPETRSAIGVTADDVGSVNLFLSKKDRRTHLLLNRKLVVWRPTGVQTPPIKMTSQPFESGYQTS